eukprot:5159462-Pyramimonas_sp.AAC.1
MPLGFSLLLLLLLPPPVSSPRASGDAPWRSPWEDRMPASDGPPKAQHSCQFVHPRSGVSDARLIEWHRLWRNPW